MYLLMIDCFLTWYCVWVVVCGSDVCCCEIFGYLRCVVAWLFSSQICLSICYLLLILSMPSPSNSASPSHDPPSLYSDPPCSTDAATSAAFAPLGPLPGSNPSGLDGAPVHSFAAAVRLGGERHRAGGVSPPLPGVDHPPPSASVPSGSAVDPPSPPGSSAPMSELSLFCLLAKLWGDSVPLPLIISKTKLDWKHVRGPVDYIELGNGWILLKFSTVADREYVWVNRPWFVKGLNLVLSSWLPFFDPYSASITHIDQWVRISRLPWEFWDETTLTSLLQPIGSVIRLDPNTLLRKKGRFARVCVHVDVTKPLPGTLSIPTPLSQLAIPLTYEGLHEVCALCGKNDHILDLCPSLPAPPKMEVMVEQFQAHGLSDPTPYSDHPSGSTSSDKWIRISPKKRGRSSSTLPARHGPSHPSVGIKIVEPTSPTHFTPGASPVNHLDKGKGKLVSEPSVGVDLPPVCGQAEPVSAPAAAPEPSEVLPDPSPTASPLPLPSPTSVLSAAEVFSSPAASPGGSRAMELDDSEDFFRDLEDLEGPVGSTDSSKKRKLEEGEEFSSPSPL